MTTPRASLLRRIDPASLLALGLLFFAIALIAEIVLLHDPHRARLALAKYSVVSDMRSEYPAPKSSLSSTDSQASRLAFDSVLSTLRPFDQHIDRHTTPIAYHDSPDSSLAAMMRGQDLHCYNIDIAAVGMLKKEGIASRLWDLNGLDGLGGTGHNVIEVWDAPLNRWYLLDPYYSCYYTREGSLPLSLYDVRELLVTGDSIDVHYYSEARRASDPRYILAELRYLTPSVVLHENNDYAWRYAHRFGSFTWASPLLDKLPMQSRRGLRVFLLGKKDRRHLIQDHHSIPYDVRQIRALFRIGLLGIVGSFVLMLFAVFVWRRNRRELSRTLAQVPAGEPAL